MITCFLFFFSTFRLSAFALSLSSFAVPRRKLPRTFPLSGFRPISIQLRSATQEAALHLPALGLSPYLGSVSQCTQEAALHLPALGLSPYLGPTSQCHAGSCFAPSCSRAFALSKTRKIQLCLQAANLDFSCFWHCSMLTDIIPHWRYFLIAVYRFLFSYYFLFCIILLYQEVFYEF